MSIHVKCDRCGRFEARPHGALPGWRCHIRYDRDGRNFLGMRHYCSDCPGETGPADEGALVCSTTEALLELEEASRMAALDNHELRGASRKLIVRALRMLDAARDRIQPQPKVHE